jgi:hypothetical protein
MNATERSPGDPPKPAEAPSDGCEGSQCRIFVLDDLKAEARAWLRQFLGDDVVPVLAVRDAALRARIAWSVVSIVADDAVIEMQSIGRPYWKLPKPPTNWRTK